MRRIILSSEECEICFEVTRMKGDYAFFNIELGFRRLPASIPRVEECSLARRDIERLLERLGLALSDEAVPDAFGHKEIAFTAYDAFFSLSVWPDMVVRLMLDYSPSYRCSVGVELRCTEEELTRFRQDWAELLKQQAHSQDTV